MGQVHVNLIMHSHICILHSKYCTTKRLDHVALVSSVDARLASYCMNAKYSVVFWYVIVKEIMIVVVKGELVM